MASLFKKNGAIVKKKKIVEGVSSKWFLRHFPLIVILIFFALAYISMRFDCLTAMETVKHLQGRLDVAKTETRRERAHYMSATSEKAMLERVDTLKLGLHLQECPAFVVEMSSEQQ